MNQIRPVLCHQLGDSGVKNPPIMQETWQEPQVQYLGPEDSLEKQMATHSSILAWKSHGERTLAVYSSWGHEELDTTWRLDRNKISYCVWAISCSGSVLQSIFQARILELGCHFLLQEDLQDPGDLLDPGMVASPPQAGGLNSLPLRQSPNDLIIKPLMCIQSKHQIKKKTGQK